MYCDLWTKEGTELTGTPWPEYPRPTLRRDSFLNLNGEWDFTVSPVADVPTVFDRHIRVPFAPESLLSGIHEIFPEENYLFYRRTFSLPDGFLRDRVLLHFGAVDTETDVWLNGIHFGSHAGGYTPFSFDITGALSEENTVVVRVRDRLSDGVFPYGKQRRNRGGMWYTPVSGIWQTVWLESVPDGYIRNVRMQTDGAHIRLLTEGADDGTVYVQTPVGQQAFTMKDGVAEGDVAAVRLWSPEDPYLYHVTVKTACDCIQTYFALRTVTVGKDKNGMPRLCLNGKPYFFHGVLDQGYFPDGLFTPASPALYEKDILALKNLGFNMLRKHIKAEPELFYYACDRLGIAVFQDMVNNGRYSFFHDTALPTLGLRKLPERRCRNADTRRRFEEGAEETVRRLEKHPSVCYYTVFNEGWGQFRADEMYEKIRLWDPTRPVDATSGWFVRKKSDVDSPHVYFRPFRMKTSGARPVVLSEFGGYSYKVPGHIFNTDKTYGYRFFDRQRDYADALERLYLDEILPARACGLSAAVYTQLSDVEDETNGLFTYDRVVCKADEKRMRAIAERLKEEK